MRYPLAALLLAAAQLCAPPLAAQTPPSASEVAAYKGLLAAVARGDLAETERLLKSGADPNAADGHGRTALHVAAHKGLRAIATALVKGGADPRAKDSRRYDILTIAGVNDDLAFVQHGLALGADPKAITSPYDGTALIAAAHLGHDGVVRELIRAGAPLDHVNNIGLTALIEAIILGDGGKRHQACVKALLDAGANPNLAGRTGASPLALARQRGYREMAAMIEKVGGR